MAVPVPVPLAQIATKHALDQHWKMTGHWYYVCSDPLVGV